MESKEIIQGIKDKGVYEFVSNNYWQLTREQLKNIILELDFAVNNIVLKSEYEEITESAIIELEDGLLD